MTTIAMKDAKAVRASIASIKTRGAKLDADIHATGVQCILHFEAHGDATLATNLYHAMPKSGRREALKVWFTTFSPMGWHKESEQFKLNKGKNANPFNVVLADETPFWDLTAEVTPEPFSLAKVAKMLSALEKRIDKGLDDDEVELSDDERAAIKRIRDALPAAPKVEKADA